MGILDRFEQSLDKLVNGAFAKAFKSELQPVEIAATLQQEMDERAAVVSRSRTLVPNEFTVSVSPEDAERLSTYADAVTGELASLVAEHAGEQRYTFLGPIVVRLRADPDLNAGMCRVASQTVHGPAASVPLAGAAPAERPPAAPPHGPRATTAQPAAGGRRVRHQDHAGGEGVRRDRSAGSPARRGYRDPLRGTTVLGRGTEQVDVRLEDPAVSRRHARITLAGQPIIEDLGSTNGTIVDGVRITRRALADGSVIRLGSTDITFRARDERARTHAARLGFLPCCGSSCSSSCRRCAGTWPPRPRPDRRHHHGSAKESRRRRAKNSARKLVVVEGAWRHRRAAGSDARHHRTFAGLHRGA